MVKPMHRWPRPGVVSCEPDAPAAREWPYVLLCVLVLLAVAVFSFLLGVAAVVA